MVRPVLLAVDDEPVALGVVEGELGKRYGADYQVVCAATPEAGLRRLEQLQADGGQLVLVPAGQWMPSRGVEDQEGARMRVMLRIKGDPEPGAAPSEELLAAMGRYNDELKTAGVLLDLAGLLPSAEGRRVKFSGGDRTVIDGPFPESSS